jgi:isopenicillin N synthase-like dioxygenase
LGWPIFRPLRSEDTRYSIAFFCHPNYDALVECLPTCLAPGEAPRHPPITGEWMRRKIVAVREGRGDAA